MTETVEKRLSVTVLLGRSLTVMRRVLEGVDSPALRSASESVPTVAASASFCAAITSTSRVTALAMEGFSVRSSAI